LGYVAAVIIESGKTGYMASVQNLLLRLKMDRWRCANHYADEHGKKARLYETCYSKALVKLDGTPFKEFAKNRAEWSIKTSYVFPDRYILWTC